MLWPSFLQCKYPRVPAVEGGSPRTGHFNVRALILHCLPAAELSTSHPRPTGRGARRCLCHQQGCLRGVEAESSCLAGRRRSRSPPFFPINQYPKRGKSPAALPAEGAAGRGAAGAVRGAAGRWQQSPARRLPPRAAPRPAGVGGAAAAGDPAPLPGLPARRFPRETLLPVIPAPASNYLNLLDWGFFNTFYTGTVLFSGRETNNHYSLNPSPNRRKLLILFENRISLQPRTPQNTLIWRQKAATKRDLRFLSICCSSYASESRDMWLLWQHFTFI